MQVDRLTRKDLPQAEQFLTTQAFTPIQQLPAWGDLQATAGAAVERIGVWENEKLVGYAQIFGKSWPLGFRQLHVPRGPLAQNQNQKVLRLLLRAIEKLAHEQKSVVVQFDWPIGAAAKIAHTVFGQKLRASGETNFPQTTLVLDLKKSEAEILAQMKPKGRYNIRLAERRGVRVRETTTPSAAKIFSTLLNKTTARDGFSGHSPQFYANFLELLGQTGNASCFIAEHDSTPIAASLCTFFGDTATYYYGASDHHFRNLMAPYAIQWAAIVAAKKRELINYDFLGIAPRSAENHPLTGVTDFKQKFGGTIVEYLASSELVLRPFVNSALQLAKRLRG